MHSGAIRCVRSVGSLILDIYIFIHRTETIMTIYPNANNDTNCKLGPRCGRYIVPVQGKTFQGIKNSPYRRSQDLIEQKQYSSLQKKKKKKNL